ncbi:hypothetical protein [Leuconostoc citreum]|uniref:hypothetical protein n=1 Tax=Leuconostoc citreum TaxID=33964 RepID=UPI0032DE8A45
MKFNNSEEVKTQLRQDLDVFISHAQEAISKELINFDDYELISKSFNYSLRKVGQINGDKK